MAEDVYYNRRVALKKLKCYVERDGFSRLAIREIQILNSISKKLKIIDHPNIIKLHGVLFSKPQDNPNESNKNKVSGNHGNIWMVFEYLPYDLYGYIMLLRKDKPIVS